MMNTWKENLEETKKHYIDWWNHEGVVVNMWEHFQNGVRPHADVAMPEAPKDLNQKWFDPQWRAQYLDWYVAHSSLKADMLPVANTQLGPGSLAAILGGVFEGGEDTIWIHPDPHYTDELHFDENHPNYLLHKQLLKACKEKAQGHYYVGMPDLMEGMDILAAIKGTDKVLMDTVMQPEVLERQMQWINNVYFKVFDELYDIIREGDEMAFCYFSAWAPGRMSKLQCDISTMISVDDYRRFVQPFIREQTEKIDYTLYHLDGVGATHHLPALLEIEKLNAIQWTPGVGEPQGGSPKWYDLYRKILDGGKSIMACWVTIDELRPLLENIGCNGVHLEMDFHNEDEVEQALEIVEQCKQAERNGEIMPRRAQTDINAMDADAAVYAIIEKVEKVFAEQARKNTDVSPLTKRLTQPAAMNHGANCDCPACSSVRAAKERTDAEKVFDAIIAGRQDDCAAATEKCVNAGMSPSEIINGQMISAMGEVGKRFEEGRAFVPQLLMAGRAMKAGLALLKPMMTGDKSVSAGKVVVGTVKGDLHDIGKNLVASMLEGSGFEVINIGMDVPAEKFIETLKETNADILCMSALLTTTMTYMKDVIDAMEVDGIRKRVKVMVGGAPVSQSFAEEIGADGYSDNANSAVALAKRLMEVRK